MASITSYTTSAGTIRWRVHYRDPERKQRSKSGFGRKRDAQAFVTSLEDDVRRGTYVAPRAGNVTVGEVYAEWLGTLTVKPTTRYTRESTWNKHVRPRWETTRVGDVRKSAVSKWVADMHDQGVGVATIENALGVLRMTLAHGVEENILAVNVAATVKAPKRQHRRRPYLTHEQVGELVSNLDGTNAAVVQFLAYTGLRWGEMAELRLRDFNLLRREVEISRATSEVQGRVVVGSPKSGEARVVGLPRFLVELARVQMDGKGQDDLVFRSPRGGHMRHSTFRDRVFRPAVEQCVQSDPAFPRGLTLHDLRHTCASLAISEGSSVLVLQRMLGHASPSITLDVYSDLFDGDLHVVADAFDRAVQGRAFA